MRHDDIWRAIDTLAAENGLSPSGLARKAGLDPTSFNLSKRRATDGKPRWPLQARAWPKSSPPPMPGWRIFRPW